MERTLEVQYQLQKLHCHSQVMKIATIVAWLSSANVHGAPLGTGMDLHHSWTDGLTDGRRAEELMPIYPEPHFVEWGITFPDRIISIIRIITFRFRPVTISTQHCHLAPVTAQSASHWSKDALIGKCCNGAYRFMSPAFFVNNNNEQISRSDNSGHRKNYVNVTESVELSLCLSSVKGLLELLLQEWAPTCKQIYAVRDRWSLSSWPWFCSISDRKAAAPPSPS